MSFEKFDLRLETIKSFAIDGLLTDGEHHKQWYLEEIIKTLGCNLDEVRRELANEGYSWEKGIIP